MYENILEKIGLTRSEISVYIALLELGSSTTGPIIKKAGIASGKAYLVLEKLIKKGLVSYVIRSGVKHFQALDPERLLDFMKQKQDDLKAQETELNKILPKLKADFAEKKYKPKAEIFEGINGFRTFMKLILNECKKGELIRIMGVSRKVNERFGPYLLEWNKERIKKGIRLEIIYNYDSREFGKLREKMKLTEVRYMRSDMDTPALIDIFNDYVSTTLLTGEPIMFVIKNKDAADSYRKYFDLVWQQSTKT